MTTDYKTLWNLKMNIPYLTSSDADYRKHFEHFTNFTRTMITEGKLDIALRCFVLAEKVYVKGDKIIKDVIINSFLHSLLITIAYSHCENLIPKILRKELRTLDESVCNERKENIDEL